MKTQTRPCYVNQPPSKHFCAAEREGQCYGLYEVCRYKVASLKSKRSKSEMPFEFYQVQSVYPKVTVDQFYKWYSNPKHMYHCVFCSNHYEGSRPDFCPWCHEYKGIEPCLQTELDSNCQLDAGWKPD